MAGGSFTLNIKKEVEMKVFKWLSNWNGPTAFVFFAVLFINSKLSANNEFPDFPTCGDLACAMVDPLENGDSGFSIAITPIGGFLNSSESIFIFDYTEGDWSVELRINGTLVYYHSAHESLEFPDDYMGEAFLEGIYIGDALHAVFDHPEMVDYNWWFSGNEINEMVQQNIPFIPQSVINWDIANDPEGNGPNVGGGGNGGGSSNHGVGDALLEPYQHCMNSLHECTGTVFDNASNGSTELIALSLDPKNKTSNFYVRADDPKLDEKIQTIEYLVSSKNRLSKRGTLKATEDEMDELRSLQGKQATHSLASNCTWLGLANAYVDSGLSGCYEKCDECSQLDGEEFKLNVETACAWGHGSMAAFDAWDTPELAIVPMSLNAMGSGGMCSAYILSNHTGLEAGRKLACRQVCDRLHQYSN